MARLWTYVGRYRVRLGAGVVCLVAATSLAMCVPWLWRSAVNEMMAAAGRVTPIFGASGELTGLVGGEFGHGMSPAPEHAGEYVARAATSGTTPDGDWQGALWHTVVLLTGIAVFQAVARTMSRSLIFNAGRDVEYDLRNDLFAHLERLPLEFYQTRRTGDLMSRLVNDVTAVRMLLGPGILNFVNTPVYYAYGLAIMCSIDPVLTVATLAVYPCVLYAVKRTSAALMERTMRVQEGLADLSSRVQETLSGIHVVKAYDSEAYETRTFAALNDRFQEASLRLARMRSFIGPLMNIVGGVGGLVVLWLGGRRVATGRLSVGDLVAFIGYLHLLAWPTMALGWMLSVFQRGRAAMQRLNDLFGVEPAIASPPGASPIAPFRGEIELRDVTFRYPSRPAGPPVLDRVSLRIPAGKTIAVVGRTGAGKTALVQLLPRLFDVEGGQVLLDGRDVRTLPLGWVRATVGLVPQDPFLFSRTIAENVGFALPDDGQERIAWALETAGLRHDLAEMPAGLDTVVGERGVTLSGGQKQRVTLARVLAADPRILVLDDALASVDASTEREILDRLRDVIRSRTTLLVAHRITTVKEADEIVVLEHGRIVEQGSHDALLARGAVYPDLFRQQALEVELEALG